MKQEHAYHVVAGPPWSALSSGRLIFAEQLRQITTNHATSRPHHATWQCYHDPARMIFGVIAPQSFKKFFNQFKNISTGVIVLQMVVSEGGS